MPDSGKRLVINTSPTLALLAAMEGSLDWLSSLYSEIIMPFEVVEEIRVGGNEGQLDSVIRCRTINCSQSPTNSAPFLRNTLDRGEAAVIQLALDRQIPLVCIDEMAGRRLARLSGLRVTGSLGVLLKAKKQNLVPRVRPCIDNMLRHGIWLKPDLIDEVIRLAGE